MRREKARSKKEGGLGVSRDVVSELRSKGEYEHFLQLPSARTYASTGP